MFLPRRSGKCRTSLDCEMPTSSNTFRVWLVTFASMAWSTDSESTVLGILDLTESLRFLQPERNFFNHLIIILWPTGLSPTTQQMFLYQRRYRPVWTHKVPELDYAAHSSVRRLSNYTQSEAMHNVWGYQIPLYYQNKSSWIRQCHTTCQCTI